MYRFFLAEWSATARGEAARLCPVVILAVVALTAIPADSAAEFSLDALFSPLALVTFLSAILVWVGGLLAVDRFMMGRLCGRFLPAIAIALWAVSATILATRLIPEEASALPFGVPTAPVFGLAVLTLAITMNRIVARNNDDRIATRMPVPARLQRAEAIADDWRRALAMNYLGTSKPPGQDEREDGDAPYDPNGDALAPGWQQNALELLGDEPNKQAKKRPGIGIVSIAVKGLVAAAVILAILNRAGPPRMANGHGGAIGTEVATGVVKATSEIVSTETAGQDTGSADTASHAAGTSVAVTPDLPTIAAFVGEATGTRDKDGHFVFDMNISGRTVPMTFDDDVPAVVLRAEKAAELGVSLDRLDFDATVALGKKRVPASEVMIRRMAVGTIVYEDVPAYVARRGAVDRDILGHSFTGRLNNWQVDADKMTLRSTN